ncbi:hypothetical protein EDD86DRAFT_104479 [Gorgonomyces haynaldii]|nr:hypothetical protein EDD86DRAFT_104479 [Gorgonomyces haynaldii]
MLFSLIAPAAACVLYNKEDCRDFKLQSFKTEDVASYLTIGTEANIPAALQDFTGLWYMNGNPLADECLSFAGVKWDEKEQAYLAKVYDEKIWTWDDNIQGRVLYQAVRTAGLTYAITAVNATTYHVKPLLRLPGYLLNKDVAIGDMLAEFLIMKTEDPNQWRRASAFFGKPVADYKFQRIVYANGTRTEKFANQYLSQIDSKVSGITLGKTQLVPIVSGTAF